MSQNRYSRTHSYSTSDAYGYSADYANLCDDDDIELDDDEFLSDGYDDDLLQGSTNRNDSSQTVRRQHHNRLEQKRRAFIRDSYTDLKDVMPEFKGKKLSRANILINTRRKVEENRRHLEDLKRSFESKKNENDREEREVINLERQLNNFDSNGGYMVDMQHSTPPLANLGINLVAGVQRPIASRRQVEPTYSDEGSSENNNTQPSHPVNSTGTSSNADTPSNSSLTDSPINSAMSSISSGNQPPTLSVSNQASSEENSNGGTWETTPAPQLEEPAVRPSALPLRRMRSFSTSQHGDSPEEKKPLQPSTTKRICVTAIMPPRSTPKN